VIALRDIIKRRARRFGRDEAGAALVEFVLVLPLMIIFFGVTVEGARMVQAFQSANAGVRDASRYLARVATPDCAVALTATDQARLFTIVNDKVTDGNGTNTTSIQVETVTATLACVSGVPIATVTATLRVAFPLGGLLEFGGAGITELTTTISDQARIYGT